MNEEKKARLNTLGTVASITVSVTFAAMIAYFFGAFKPMATGYFWYDVKCLLNFVYNSVIVPCCLFYAGVVLSKLFRSWLFPNKEAHIPASIEELKEQCSWLDRRMDQVENKEHNVIIRVQELEAKMIVICSILSLNKSEELKQSATDVLKDCAR